MDDKQVLQETFNAINSWSPALVVMYEMHDGLCKQYRDRIDPKSNVFPDGYYDGLREIARTFGVKFTDPRGVKWQHDVREGNITVH